MMKKYLQLILIFCLTPCAALAEKSTLSTDDAHSKSDRVILTVAIEEMGYAPYNYLENGAIKGFTIDVLEYFKAHSKYDFDFIILPWPRALHLVEQGKVDLILTLFKNPKQEQSYHFVEPSYGLEASQFFSLTSSKLTFAGRLTELTPYSIGTKREVSYGKSFDEADYLTKLPALTEKVLLKLLLAKRIDVAISNPFIFQQLMSEQGVVNKVTPLEPFVDITPVYFALTKKRTDALEIKKTLGQLTKQLKATTYYEQLLDKYLLDFD